jgi:peptidoglycan/xylan/chitin deacetylase (PgdA/CDA1 family)
MKRGVELGLCQSGVAALARRLRRHDVLVLAYHNVVPDGVEVRGERSLHIGQEQLHRQLTRLSRTHDIVPVDRIREPGTGRARVVITFDDAYRGAVLLGGEVLADVGVPATIFVAPGLLGGQRFWWDLVSRDGEMDDETREMALTALEGKAEAVLAGMVPAAEPDDGRYLISATEAELENALGMDGLTLGSHSWSHPNLTMLGQAELAEELGKSLEWLAGRYRERVIRWLSYPYGRWSPDVARATEAAGYGGAFRIEGGRLRGEHPPFATPRLNVPAGLSVEGLSLRAAGLVGA